MLKIVEASHLFITEYVKRSQLPFIRCCDATCGRGNDTLFLANLLKDKGHVDAYDIQIEAINSTSKLLEENKVTNVTLHHESFVNIIPSNYDLVIFNLGYMPGGDKNITTLEKDTMEIVKLLSIEVKFNPHFMIVLSVYPGHNEGHKESESLDSFVKSLPSKDYMVSKYLNYNRPESPYILTISKNEHHCN